MPMNAGSPECGSRSCRDHVTRGIAHLAPTSQRRQPISGRCGNSVALLYTSIAADCRFTGSRCLPDCPVTHGG